MDEFLTSLAYWFEQQGITATITSRDGNTADVALYLPDEDIDPDDDEDEGEFYIGSYADPGMHVTWLGEFDLGGEEKDTLVRVNGIVMSAIARSVVGWAVGLD